MKPFSVSALPTLFFPSQDAKLKIEAIQWMLKNAAKGHDLRSSRQLLKVRSLSLHEAHTDVQSRFLWSYCGVC